MTKERIYENETAAETAKKIRKMLKEAFPSIKFSVRSSTYSMGSNVYVHWTDGPLQSDVNEILSRFKSGYFDGGEDMYVSTGYEWEGKTVIGAEHFSSSRQLSPERKAAIEAKLSELFEPDIHGDFCVFEWAVAEKQLIDEGQLQGFPSQLPEPVAADPEEIEAPAEAAPSISQGWGKVIEFPVQAVRDPELAAERRVEKLMNSLTPEQRLKLMLLQSLVGSDEVTKLLLAGKSTIDEIFTIIAERVFTS